MTKSVSARLAALIIAAAVSPFAAIAADGAQAALTRPAGYTPIAGDLKLGEQLFNDSKLSTNGMSCASCHANHGAFSAGFAQPYPHTVNMAKDQLGIKSIQLDEMIQACMVMPMAAKPLPWNSKELAALVAYMQSVQKTFKPNN